MAVSPPGGRIITHRMPGLDWSDSTSKPSTPSYHSFDRSGLLTGTEIMAMWAPCMPEP
jgi:hypothetical protein